MAWTVDDPIKRESDFNVMCVVAHFFGVILVLAAIGLWFVPGAFGAFVQAQGHHADGNRD